MTRLLRSLRRDQRGTSVIEFGLFAPVLGLMLMGITYLSMGYARKLELEQAAFRSLEKIQVGYSATSYASLQAEAAAAAGVPASAVTVDQWLECDRTRQTSFTGTCVSGQETSRYVGVTIRGSYTPRFDYGVMTTTAGNVPITAFKSVRIQ